VRLNTSSSDNDVVDDDDDDDDDKLKYKNLGMEIQRMWNIKCLCYAGDHWDHGNSK
jgi:hypothetical protein